MRIIRKARGPVSLTVAASNTAAKIKARADYVCDGTADDVQINAAIDALPATGGKVELSEGTFECINPIDLDGKPPLALVGSGSPNFFQSKAATLLKFDLGGAGNCFDLQNNHTGGAGPSIIEDIGIEGVGNCDNGMYLGTDCVLCSISRVVIFGTFSVAGFHSLGGSNASTQNSIHKVYVKDVAPVALLLGGADNSYIDISAVYSSVVGGSKGMYLKDLNSSTIIHPFVYKAELAMDIGTAGSSKGDTIVGLHIEECTDGLYFNGASQHINVFGGKIDATTHATNAAVRFAQCDAISVFGLHIEDSTTSHKSFEATAGVTNILCVGCHPEGTTPYTVGEAVGTVDGADLTVRDDATKYVVSGLQSIKKSIDHADITDVDDTGYVDFDTEIPAGSYIKTVRCDFVQSFNSDDTTTLTMMIGPQADLDAYNTTADPGENAFNHTTDAIWEQADCQDAVVATAAVPRVTFTEDNDITHIISSGNAQGKVTITITYMKA